MIWKADGTPVVAATTKQIQPISASALALDFRAAALTSGAVTTVAGTPSTLVISNGSTLGTVSGVQSRIAVLALNNAGTIELAAINIAGGTDLSETGVISTSAEGGAGAADSAAVAYSTTARASVAYRVLGYIESTQAAAGTWATAPSTIQGAGGNASMAMSAIGYGQTWQAVTRNAGTTYYNSSGKPIMLAMWGASLAAGQVTVSISINGGPAIVFVSFGITGGGNYGAGNIIIPPGSSYVLTASNFTVTGAAELR